MPPNYRELMGWGRRVEKHSTVTETGPNFSYFPYWDLKNSDSREASQVALVVKNPPGRAGKVRDLVQSLGGDDPLETEMATHSSILVWRIPWTEPGGLQSRGSQRVGHDWSDLLFIHSEGKREDASVLLRGLTSQMRFCCSRVSLGSFFLSISMDKPTMYSRQMVISCWAWREGTKGHGTDARLGGCPALWQAARRLLPLQSPVYCPPQAEARWVRWNGTFPQPPQTCQRWWAGSTAATVGWGH